MACARRVHQDGPALVVRLDLQPAPNQVLQQVRMTTLRTGNKQKVTLLRKNDHPRYYERIKRVYKVIQVCVLSFRSNYEDFNSKGNQEIYYL